MLLKLYYLVIEPDTITLGVIQQLRGLNFTHFDPLSPSSGIVDILHDI